MTINLIRLTCMKMIVYWNAEMIICWNVKMIICWNVENVLDWNADSWFWWNNQNCIWCWCHLMHWRFSDVINDAAFDLERLDALMKLFDVENAAFDFKRSDALTKLFNLLLAIELKRRINCWLKCSLLNYRADELFDWWNDANVAKRQMWFCWQCCRAKQNIDVLIDVDQNRVKTDAWWLFIAEQKDDINSYENYFIRSKSAAIKLIESYRIFHQQINQNRNLLQLNQSNRIKNCFS